MADFKKLIFKNSFWLFTGEIVSRLFLFFLFIYIARELGPREFGIFSFSFAFGSLFLIFSNLGLSEITVREMSKNQMSAKDYSGVLSLKILLSVMAYIFIFLAAFFIGFSEHSEEGMDIIRILGVYTVAHGFLNIIYAYFRARHKALYEAALKISEAFLIALFGFIALFYANTSIVILSWMFPLAALCAVIFSLAILSFKIRPLFSFSFRSMHFLGLAWPLGLSYAFGMVYLNTDSVMLGLWGQISQVGWYGAAYRIVNVFVMPVSFMGIIFLPFLSRFFHESREKFKEIFNFYIKLTAVVSVVVLVLGVALSRTIVEILYGAEFLPAVLALQILIVFAFFNYLSSPFYIALLAIGRQKSIFWASFFSAIINILLNFTLIPRYSLYGAAAATAVSYFFLALLFFIFYRKFVLRNYLPETRNYSVRLLIHKVAKKANKMLYRIEYFRRALFGININAFSNSEGRYDLFVIWGHGLPYKEEVLKMIREAEFLEIKKVLIYKVTNMPRFIREVYRYSYVPFIHTWRKTRYLLNTDSNVCIVFVYNKNPQEEFLGEGVFRHLECINIKSLKTKIREKFNTPEYGLETNNHVVHASDHQLQTDHLLKYLGFSEGIGYFNKKSSPFLDLPHYLEDVGSFTIEKVPLSKIYCRIPHGNHKRFENKLMPIEDTPHYRYLAGEKKPYVYLLENFKGYLMTDDYSTERFDSLFRKSNYLAKPHEHSYILLEKLGNGNYLLIEGAHRTAKMLFLGNKEILAAVKENKNSENILFFNKNYFRGAKHYLINKINSAKQSLRGIFIGKKYPDFHPLHYSLSNKYNQSVPLDKKSDGKIYPSTLDLNDFFFSLRERTYVIVRLKNFPGYCQGEDIDIFCQDMSGFVRDILTVGNQYVLKNNLAMRVSQANDASHVQVDFYKGNSLEVKFDIHSSLPKFRNIRVKKTLFEDVLKNRTFFGGICGGLKYNVYIPSFYDDMTLRYIEYCEWRWLKPQKAKHLEFILGSISGDERKKNNLIKSLQFYTNLQDIKI